MKRKASVHTRRNVADGICEIDYVDGTAVAAAQLDIPSDALITEAAEALRVIGNPARMRLLIALKDHELCVCDCAALLKQSLSAASQHLKELRRLGAVQFRQDGKLAYYRMDNGHWSQIVAQALEHVHRVHMDVGS